jgi:hypothetical protein
MIVDEKKIEEIVAKVLERLGGSPTAAPTRVPVAEAKPTPSMPIRKLPSKRRARRSSRTSAPR